METIDSLIRRVQQSEHGFLDIQKAADEVYACREPDACAALAHQLYASEIPQARRLAVFLFGRLAARDSASLLFLKTAVSLDADWRVQEILAKAFDRFCADRGYEAALPIIQEWLADGRPNTRRAVTEGLTIWTGRPYFREHPAAAVRLLSALHADESEYVRKSVGNALRDISRKHKELVRAELAQWDLSQKKIQQTHRLASKFL